MTVERMLELVLLNQLGNTLTKMSVYEVNSFVKEHNIDMVKVIRRSTELSNEFYKVKNVKFKMLGTYESTEYMMNDNLFYKRS